MANQLDLVAFNAKVDSLLVKINQEKTADGKIPAEPAIKVIQDLAKMINSLVKYSNSVAERSNIKDQLINVTLTSVAGIVQTIINE